MGCRMEPDETTAATQEVEKCVKRMTRGDDRRYKAVYNEACCMNTRNEDRPRAVHSTSLFSASSDLKASHTTVLNPPMASTLMTTQNTPTS